MPQNRIDAFNALGFDWGTSFDDNWEKNLLALATYEDIHGHLRVPYFFVIPADDHLWPERTHGMKLGSLVNDLRRRKDTLPQNRIDALDALGFDWGTSLGDNWEKKLMALATYGNLNGHMRVPYSFVVPANDPMWPEATHDIKLGSLVKDLRSRKDTLPQNRIDALNFFGFEWAVNHG